MKKNFNNIMNEFKNGNLPYVEMIKKAIKEKTNFIVSAQPGCGKLAATKDAAEKLDLKFEVINCGFYEENKGELSAAVDKTIMEGSQVVYLDEPDRLYDVNEVFQIFNREDCVIVLGIRPKNDDYFSASFNFEEWAKNHSVKLITLPVPILEELETKLKLEFARFLNNSEAFDFGFILSYGELSSGEKEVYDRVAPTVKKEGYVQVCEDLGKMILCDIGTAIRTFLDRNVATVLQGEGVRFIKAKKTI